MTGSFVNRAARLARLVGAWRAGMRPVAKASIFRRALCAVGWHRWMLDEHADIAGVVITRCVHCPEWDYPEEVLAISLGGTEGHEQARAPRKA